MSLLMKALEKAAKDRGEARPEAARANAPAAASSTPSTAAPARSELSLEPISASQAPAAAPLRADTAPRPAAPPRSAQAAPPAAAPAAEAADRAQSQKEASTVLQAQAAGRPARSGVGEYVSTHPVLVFGTLAALVAIGFGIYVYLQIFHPGLFVNRPPAPKGPLPPMTQAPAGPAAVPAPPAALPSAPLLKEAAESPPAAAAVDSPRPKPAPAAAAQEEPARNAISVSAGNAAPVLNPLHTQAYAALQSGQVDEAQRLYGQLAGSEPRNVQALLGLAAIASRQGKVDEATQRYLQVLDLEPRNALAQSGLIALLGRADPQAAESRLKQLIAREPSAHLHFTLGNLYADQSQWAAAQQAYFQAHHLESANPDYAYNLAVALEHVGQPRLALGFYQRALQLAAGRGRANFNLTQAQERVRILAQRVE
jgi:tetratricopeptide (TPR) repeat protein